MEDNMMVSIICNTYNQEDYIADALESFIKQKTNFKFEVLVHDDASTDKTADIIRMYEEKYPEIIKPIYEKENQYSKHDGTIRKLQSQRACGKYIALCEGDDYWTDENKLQRQVDFMENNPEYSLCVHYHVSVNAQTNQIIHTYKRTDKDIDLTTGYIILHNGDNLATNSMLFIAEYYKNFAKEGWKFPVGDYPLAMYLAFLGKVRCLHYIMSAYRVDSKGSWSERFMSDNVSAKKKRIDLLKKLIKLLTDFDVFTHYKYHKYMQKKQIIMLHEISQKSKECGEIHLFKNEFKKLKWKQKLIYYCYYLEHFKQRLFSILKGWLKKIIWKTLRKRHYQA